MARQSAKEAGDYAEVPEFYKSVSTEDIRKNDFVLTPGRYVGAEDVAEDGEPFWEKMGWLVAKLGEQSGNRSGLKGRLPTI